MDRTTNILAALSCALLCTPIILTMVCTAIPSTKKPIGEALGYDMRCMSDSGVMDRLCQLRLEEGRQ